MTRILLMMYRYYISIILMNYKVSFNGDTVQFSQDARNIASVPLGNFKLNTGASPSSQTEFERDQQIVNFLDSVKDGTNKFQLMDLGIYPLAGPTYPSFPADLKHIEETILKSVSAQLEHTTWVKVKKGSELDKPKPYRYCFWESGLGFESFFKDPKTVKTVKTFGSYIDPLEKQNADIVWPKIGDSIEISPDFMKLVGFGESSKVEAKTRTNTEFDYTMTIGCGTGCSDGECVIKNTDANAKQYFAGNNEKKILLKTDAGSKEKVKTIVVKEWGDKVQVLIYLMYSKNSRGETFMMITCDMVVFMLCINMGVPCIYTGAYNPPKSPPLDKTKKYYSILEYNPQSASRRDFIAKYNQKRSAIEKENKEFEACIQSLVDHPNTPVYVQDQEKIFRREFYEGILSDIQFIKTKFPSVKPPQTDAPVDATFLSAIQKDIDELEKNHLLVPMIKVQKVKTQKRLIMLMTRTYIGSKGAAADKPGVLNKLQELRVANPDKESKRSFYDIANTHFKASGLRGGVGSPPSVAGSIIIDKFPETDTEPKWFRSNGEIENIAADAEFNSSTTTDVFNPNLSRALNGIEGEARGTGGVDFQRILDVTFKSSMDEYLSYSYKTIEDVDAFSETVYLLFMYDAYFSKSVNPIVSVEDINRIVEEYDILPKVEYKSYKTHALKTHALKTHAALKKRALKTEKKPKYQRSKSHKRKSSQLLKTKSTRSMSLGQRPTRSMSLETYSSKSHNHTSRKRPRNAIL